jgi:hypothetical protein
MSFKWNLFAEGEVEDIKDLPKLDNALLYVLVKCRVCNETVWIKHPLTVCSNCIP